MSTALVQDPSGSTLPINQETGLSNGDDSYSHNVVQPTPRASHSRQTSAAKRKRAQSSIDMPENLVETTQAEVNGHDKSKRQKLGARASSEKRTGPTKPMLQNGYPLPQVAEEPLQFSETYVSPWTPAQPHPGPLIQSAGVKETEREMKAPSGSSTMVPDTKPTPETSEQTQNSFPTTPNFKRAFFGNKIIEPWYFSPYPPGDIAAHAYSSNVPIPLFNGDHHHGGRFTKGQFRKSSNMGFQGGVVNGYITNGAGPSRSGTRHDIPSHAKSNTLYVCERCFAYSDRPTRNPFQSSPHVSECISQLPGRLVYDDQDPSVEANLDVSGRHNLESIDDIITLHNGAPSHPRPEKEGRVRMYEVDPVTSLLHKTFCKNITLFGKFFIDSKSIVFDCSTFLYYIITIVENGNESIAGFFTKEKESVEEYNLACIIVFPPYQRKGLGRLLIQFSYELSKHDGKIGSPEKPLSTLGTRSYSPVWVTMVLDYLHEQIAIPYEMSLDRPKGNAKRHRNPLGTARTLKSKSIHEDGHAMETHLQFSCTLEQIAAGAYLTVSDASFALAELGLQKYITGFQQHEFDSRPRTPGGSNTGGQSRGTEAEVSQGNRPAPVPGADAGFPDQPPSGVLANSTRDLQTTTVGEPEVPILTREFIRLVEEKSRFRRKPINKEFVLL